MVMGLSEMNLEWARHEYAELWVGGGSCSEQELKVRAYSRYRMQVPEAGKEVR